jgi:hypothetical protein
MKKLIITIVFFLNLLPCLHKGGISIQPVQKVYAQACPPNPNGSGGGGGGFWNWLGNILGDVGNAISNVATAIADFFSGGGDTDGESFGDETESEGGVWELGSDGLYEPVQDPADFNPMDDPWFHPDGWGDDEWQILQDLSFYYQIYTSGGTLPPSEYYITLEGDTTKYYKGDTICVAQKSTPAKLTVHKENGTVNAATTYWKRNDTAKCAMMDNCLFDVSTAGRTIVKVDSSGVKKLTENPLVVYNLPTIYFQKKDGYNGEYAFDDSMHQYLQIRNNPKYAKGYEVKRINQDTAYFVPWMGILDGQVATVKMKKTGLISTILHDPKFFVEFVAINNDSIRINQVRKLKLNYSQLQNLNVLDIIATQWNLKADSLKIFTGIYAIAHTGDTIGKMNLSCVKPQTKQVTFIYVNTGNGYDSTRLSKLTLLNTFNITGHNQMMRRWVLTNQYPDTLDLSAEYLAYPSQFHYDSILRTLRHYYFMKQNIDMLTENAGIPPKSPNRKYFVFITKMIHQLPDGSYVTGETKMGGPHGCLHGNANFATANHEMGHILNHKHVWELPFNIPRQTTDNLMDYVPDMNNDYRIRFSFFQWVETL